MGCLIKVTGIFTCLNLPRVCNFSVAVDGRRDYLGSCNYMDCKRFLKKNLNFANRMNIARKNPGIGAL